MLVAKDKGSGAEKAEKFDKEIIYAGQKITIKL